MQYRPTQFDDSVNVTAGHPLITFLKHVATALTLVVAAYLLLGLLVDLTVRQISVEQENWLFQQLGMQHLAPSAKEENAALQQKLQTLLDGLPAEVKPAGYHFRLLIDDSKKINAYAVPGGAIVVTQGLLNALESENALVYVLGHEMGHFAQRDHLRGMGRGLVTSIIGLALFGADSTVSELLANATLAMDYNHSREQERGADDHGLAVLVAHYGHAGGATEFFTKVRKEAGRSEWLGYGSTHPLSSERIQNMEDAIRKKHIPVRPVAPAFW